jgi:D-amino-acid dehydrogenase
MTRKITVIGAGIVGTATAAYLKRDGHDVTLVDMQPPGEYTSFGNAGILSPGSCVPLATPGIVWNVPGYLADPMGPLSVRWSYMPRAMPWFMRFLAASSPARVEKIADALRALLRQTFDAYEPLVQHAGVQDLVRHTGYIVVYEHRKAYEGDATAWRLRRERGVVVEEIDDKAIHERVPQLGGHYDVGLWLPEQGYVANPERLTKSLAAQFQRDGGRFVQAKVLDIELRDGKAAAIRMDDGSSLPVETLVLSAGVHTRALAARLGDRVPLEAERGYHVTFTQPGIQLPMPVFAPEHKFFVTPMEMGLRIAGQSEFAGIDPDPDYRRAKILAKHAQRMFPKLDAAESTEWMGRRPSLPDSLPIIGPASRVANVYYAFGHGHTGLCGGAPTGRIIADLIAGRRPSIDVAPYSVSRFS